MAAGLDCGQRQQAEVASRTATRGGGRGREGSARGEGRPLAPLLARSMRARSGCGLGYYLYLEIISSRIIGIAHGSRRFRGYG
jgi:hypothetical protein